MAMRSAVAIATVALACASIQAEPRLFGAWKSNYDLTVAEFRKVPDITAAQLELLSDPELFGHMIQIYGPQAAIVVYEGECSLTPYEVVERDETYADIRYYDELLEERTVKRVFFEADAIWLRVGKAREIFTPVDLEVVRSEYECVNTLLGSSG